MIFYERDEKMGTVIIGLILIIIAGFSLRGSFKHMKGEGGCCGGGSQPKVKKQKLKEIRETKVFKIEGMSCDNCRKRIENELNSIEQVNAKVSLKNKEAVIRLGTDIEDEILIQCIEKLGYKVKRDSNNGSVL